jgi:hypothetical protein
VKNKKIHTVRTVSKSNRKIKKILHRRNSFKISWLDTGTSIKSSGVKQVLRANISPLSEMMRLCKCFPMWVKCKLSNITGQKYVIFVLVDKPEMYVGRINISSPYVNNMNKSWTYDGGNGYILILRYESFENESALDFVTVSVWHDCYH